MDIVTYPNKILLRDADEIGEITPEIVQLGKDMLELMYANGGIGLAGPQVGVSKRIIVVNIHADPQEGQEYILVNPEITKRSDELVTRSEGCLSFPGISGPVSRWSRVWVEALDLEGREVEIEASGLLCIALQHEIDHLNGILFISKLPPASKALIKGDLNKLKEKAAVR